tara:strand:+ start:332 stop:727 length:396 start_codon:yes stop_codon:yes gene_type:complete
MDISDNILPKNLWIKISKKLFNHYKVKPNKLIITTSDKDNDKFHSKAFYDLYNRTITLNLDRAESNKDLLTSILHEIHHMIDEKKLGFDTYDMMYQHEMGKGNYKKNKFEINAENFALREVNKWKNIIDKL